jgi:hypothetical protein
MKTSRSNVTLLGTRTVKDSLFRLLTEPPGLLVNEQLMLLPSHPSAYLTNQERDEYSLVSTFFFRRASVSPRAAYSLAHFVLLVRGPDTNSPAVSSLFGNPLPVVFNRRRELGYNRRTFYLIYVCRHGYSSRSL